MFVCYVLAALVACSTTVKALFGEASFYGGNVEGGMCSFTEYSIPSGLFGTALSDSNWDDAQSCGACAKVKGPNGKSITVMVVDQCPGCGENHLDLFEDGFTKLADKSKGVINVDWEFCPCGISSPLEVKMKDGVSANYFSAQVVNANKRVKDMQVSTDGGKSWKKGLQRQDFNFFEMTAGFGTTQVSVKVISVDNDEIVVGGCKISSGGTTKGDGNF